MALKVEALHIYPIKSLRGISLPSATLLKHGFPYDRRFMLLREHPEGFVHPKSGSRYENMHVSGFPAMCLFTTSLSLPPDSTSSGGGSGGSIDVTYRNPDTGEEKHISVPLTPDTSSLEEVDVNMHNSRTTALRMPASYSQWFSARFGFPVVFAYLDPKLRPVLGNIAPNAAARNAAKRREIDAGKSWTGSLTKSLGGLLGSGKENGRGEDEYEIGFADCAEYLVVSRTSLEDVSRRLPEGEEMDITKFRPNIIVSGAKEAFDEDYWGELTITPDSWTENDSQQRKAEIQLTANCVRCPSINVDYCTGKPGTGEQGKVLKKLQADRRIDTGHKYSPVFGRYGFLRRDGREEQGVEVRVGDEVRVSVRNGERSVFRWPGMGITPKEDIYPVEETGA